MANEYIKELAKEAPFTPTKEFYDMLFAEVGGGSPDEVAAVASVYMNLSRQLGYEKAMKRSSAFNKKSPQYQKASTGNMNGFEKLIYNRNKSIIDNLATSPDKVLPYDHHENINAFGEPSWASSMKAYKDIGRQRFYRSK